MRIDFYHALFASTTEGTARLWESFLRRVPGWQVDDGSCIHIDDPCQS